MKILIIGGTGHTGSFLVPMLAAKGEAVTVVSRKATSVKAEGWEKVQIAQAIYEREDSKWQNFIRETDFDVLIDMLGADLPGTYEAAKDHCKQVIVCGSLWMFGPPRIVPTPEKMQGPSPLFEGGTNSRYGELLSTMKLAAKDGIKFTAILPPNICGPGKIPLEGHGGRSLQVHKAHMEGKPVKLFDGCNTLIGPCDAEDIAQGFFRAVCEPEEAAGEIFNVGAAYSLPASEFIQTYAEIYGSKIPIEFVSSETYFGSVLPSVWSNYHFSQHMLPDISKIRSKLGYEPKYTPEETMARAVAWMKDQGML